MASDELDALVHALCESDGLPVPTAEEFAQRVLQQLRRLGYEIVRHPAADVVIRNARGDVMYGIRPHLPRTREEDEMARRVYESMPGPDLGDFLRQELDP